MERRTRRGVSTGQFLFCMHFLKPLRPGLDVCWVGQSTPAYLICPFIFPGRIGQSVPAATHREGKYGSLGNAVVVFRAQENTDMKVKVTCIMACATHVCINPIALWILANRVSLVHVAFFFFIKRRLLWSFITSRSFFSFPVSRVIICSYREGIFSDPELCDGKFVKSLCDADYFYCSPLVHLESSVVLCGGEAMRTLRCVVRQNHTDENTPWWKGDCR